MGRIRDPATTKKEQAAALDELLDNLKSWNEVLAKVGQSPLPKGPVSGYSNSMVEVPLETIHLPVGHPVIGNQERSIIADPVLRAYREKYPQSTFVEAVWSEDENGNSILTILGTTERRMTAAERWASMAQHMGVSSTEPIDITTFGSTRPEFITFGEPKKEGK